MKRTPSFLMATAGFAGLLFGVSRVEAQTAPPLGAAQSFAALAGSTLTNTGGSVVSGNVGVSPGSAITGFPPGTVVSGTLHPGDATAAAAQTSATGVYNNLSGQACNIDLTGQNLGGLTLTPNVYCFSSSAFLTGTLTLDAGGNPNAAFVFKMGSTLITASGSSILLINGASACNLFWQVGSSATLGSGSSFNGNIVALTSITLTTGVNLTGRALALTGAVTLDTNLVTAPCAGIVACPPITLSPATLPSGKVSVAYSQTIAASGGTPPYAFAVTSGPLPPGLTLTSAGVLAGVPNIAGTYTFTIRGTDANGCFAETTYSVVIAIAACPSITLSPPTVPPGRLGVPYSQQVTASGGTGPYVFTVLSGALPAGLTLSASGLISGTPTTLGTRTVSIQATDNNACPGVISYTIIIAPAACPVITLAPPTLPAGTLGVAYSQQITASGGTAPYVFTVLSGALPPGLTLSPVGLVSGTPTTLGSSTVVIQATDGNGCPGIISYTIVIQAVVPTLPQAFFVLLALLLTSLGYFRLRRQVRTE